MRAKELLEVVERSGAIIENSATFDTCGVSGEYYRNLYLSTPFIDLCFVWWNNIMYVEIDGLTVMFDSIEVNTTWPNKYKCNLALMKNGGIIAIIPTMEK